jgi:hypothetical protein
MHELTPCCRCGARVVLGQCGRVRCAMSGDRRPSFTLVDEVAEMQSEAGPLQPRQRLSSSFGSSSRLRDAGSSSARPRGLPVVPPFRGRVQYNLRPQQQQHSAVSQQAVAATELLMHRREAAASGQSGPTQATVLAAMQAEQKQLEKLTRTRNVQLQRAQSPSHLSAQAGTHLPLRAASSSPEARMSDSPVPQQLLGSSAQQTLSAARPGSAGLHPAVSFTPIVHSSAHHCT